MRMDARTKKATVQRTPNAHVCLISSQPSIENTPRKLLTPLVPCLMIPRALYRRLNHHEQRHAPINVWRASRALLGHASPLLLEHLQEMIGDEGEEKEGPSG